MTKPTAVDEIFWVVLGKKTIKIFGVVFDFQMGDFVEKNMAELGQGKENNLPVKIKIAQRRTGAETGFLITKSEAMIGKRKLLTKVGKLVGDERMSNFFKAGF